MKKTTEIEIELGRIRARIELFIDGLIQALDHIDTDQELDESDLEDGDSDADDAGEPSLGAAEDVDQRKSWLTTNPHQPDLEQDTSCTSSV